MSTFKKSTKSNSPFPWERKSRSENIGVKEKEKVGTLNLRAREVAVLLRSYSRFGETPNRAATMREAADLLEKGTF